MKPFLWPVVFFMLAFFLSAEQVANLQAGTTLPTAVWPIAILVFSLAYAIRPLFLIPDSIMLILGTLLFGPVVGWVLGYIGENVSASVAFIVGRRLGQRSVEKSHTQFITKLDSVISAHGMKSIIFLRLIPFMPFDLINYGAGATRVKYSTYAIATAVGVIPGLTVFVLAGGAFAKHALLVPAAIGFAALLTVTLAIRTWKPDIFALSKHTRAHAKAKREHLKRTVRRKITSKD